MIQDGKLYGRESIFHVICRASALPESLKNHDIQKSEALMQLGQVIVKCTMLDDLIWLPVTEFVMIFPTKFVSVQSKLHILVGSDNGLDN